MLYQRWSKMPPLTFLLVALILGYTLSIPIAITFELFGFTDRDINGPDLNKFNLIEGILLIVIITPILETLIGQLLPIRLCQITLKWNTNKIAVISSTTLFAIGHLTYSVWYFLLLLPFGLTLALTYTIFQRRKESPFLMTTLLHALKNLIALILSCKEFAL
jgi:membrane protease YdiL (CAAX protease family)